MAPSVGSPVLWAGFTVFVLVAVLADLGLVQRAGREMSYRQALLLSIGWILLALIFNALVYVAFGPQHALEYLTGYLIEKSLSVDNLFVFLVIFSMFAIPRHLQHRVLLWGILGALVMRAVFILLGAALLERFHWMVYVFGGFLAVTGARLLVHRNEEVHPERNPLFRLFRRVVPAVPDLRGERFVVRVGGRWHATPMLLALVLIESADVVFAVDSIPAVFAVTRDPFIVYTSNIFAILGLRALYFLIAGLVERLRYLKVGLGLVLVFVGVKMGLSEVYHVPAAVSLGVVAALLGGTAAASLLHPAAQAEGVGEAAREKDQQPA